MKAKGKPPVTIYEIADHVGVSPAAVSSVLANRHVERRIAAKTVERILAAVRELGYVPNMAGRRLRAHTPATRQFDLAILTSFEAPLPLVGQALHALQMAVDKRTAEDTRFAVSIEMFHAGRLSEKPGLLDSSRYHGVIITNTLPVDDEFLAGAVLPYVVVVLGRRIKGYCCVLEEPDFVGRQAAQILLDAGCSHPAVLHGRMLTQATANRVEAFRATVKKRLGIEAIALETDGLQPSDGAESLQRFLKKKKPCDGIFSVTDSLAMGAYQALRDAKKQVPADIAVVGVGDHEFVPFFDPPMSSVAGANEAMVSEAIPLLFARLTGEETAPREVLVKPPVCLRQSTKR